MTTKQNALAAVALGLTLVASLAACSGPDTDRQTADKSTSAPTQSTTPSVEHNVCKDGAARVLASDLEADKPFTLDCDRVNIVGQAKQGTTVELGAVSKLVVEGDGVTVHADSAAEIVVPGNGNTITHGGESSVQDAGQGNTITQQ